MKGPKKIKLAVRDFAVPAPRVGSIESLSGFGRAQELGLELHKLIQAKRAQESPGYRAEVWTQRSFAAGGFLFEVGGKLDGLFEGRPPRVEEIKTAFNAPELARRLRDNPDTHPYCLQLKTYGYFHYKRTGELPELSLHVVSTRDGAARDVALALDVAAYEAWLERRLAELVLEARAAQKRAARRKKTAAALAFPFPRPRPGQRELSAEVEAGMAEKRPMLLQAPTGLGKTVGVLFPALKEALSRGQRVVYVTPKNSQHGVAEDAVERLHAAAEGAGGRLRALTLTAKGKLCLKEEPLCDPAYCQYAKDHYAKTAAAGLTEVLAKKRRLTARAFRALALEHEVCPYELQLDAAQDADAVICDYNYVFSPRSTLALSGRGLDQEGKPNLVVDEAHNLPARSLDYYSPQLSVSALETLREKTAALPAPWAGEAAALFEECRAALLSCAPPGGGPAEIAPPSELFHAQDERLRAFLARYLAADAPIAPGDPVLLLCRCWSEFCAALDAAGQSEAFFTTYQPAPPAVKLTCCDASAFLRERYEDFSHVVGFSATLKPFRFYAELGGLPADAARTAEFPSPFPGRNRKLLVIPQLSSRWSRRQSSYPRVAQAIARVAALKRGNYFAFFPSFDFLERTLALFSPPDGFAALRQERRMSRDAVEAVLEKLRAPGGAHVVFAVQGGVFSEGVDYPGEMAVGAFVVGPPLPTFDLERERMRAYYEKRYGAGFDYAYVYPAMAKAVQAAGRVIRSETDRGLIVLMDDRFIEPAFSKCMPKDWFADSPRELVSGAILADVAAFWAAAEK